MNHSWDQGSLSIVCHLRGTGMEERHPSGPECLEQLLPIIYVLTNIIQATSVSIHSNVKQSRSISCFSLIVGFCLFVSDSATVA